MTTEQLLFGETEAIEAMTFLNLFDDVTNRAVTQGMKPRLIYLGPDVLPIFADYAVELCWHGWNEKPKSKEECVQAIMKAKNLGIFHGMQVLRMECPGIAVRAGHQPESGFDLL